MSELMKQDSNTPTIANAELVSKAIESNSMEALERLMDLQEKWEAKQARKSFYDAMAEFQSKCPVIIKKKQGHNYKYAPMEDIISQVSGLIALCGLSYRWEQSQSEGSISVSCIVTHRDGHSETLTISGGADGSGSKNSIQAIGSTVSYLKRYTFLGSFGIATADEDIDGRIDSIGGETITQSQAEEIEDLIVESQSDRKALLNWLKCDSVDKIPASKFDRAITALKQKAEAGK